MGDSAECIGPGADSCAITIGRGLQFAHLLKRHTEIHLGLGQVRPQRDAPAIRGNCFRSIFKIVVEEAEREMDLIVCWSERGNLLKQRERRTKFAELAKSASQGQYRVNAIRSNSRSGAKSRDCLLGTTEFHKDRALVDGVGRVA